MRKPPPITPPSRRRAQLGQALIEYSVITALAVLVLVAFPEAIPALLNAMKNVYESFTFAISLSWI